MTDAKKVNALFKAATAGNTAKIRALIAAGAPIEAADLNRKTPVMLAAEAGHAEAFHCLVHLGANLSALALDETDLLECAAEGGNVEIIRFLLDRGHPVEGHWQARSKVDQRMGHLTPLMIAAINGRVEAVRVLLAAGANPGAKFDGETAVQMLAADIKHPFGPEEVERVPRLQEIVALLKRPAAAQGVSEPEVESLAQADRKPPEDSVESEVEKFAKNAGRPAYRKLVRLLEQRCGPAAPWQPLPDHGLPATNVVRFTLAGCERQKVIEGLQEEARQAGCHLVLADAWVPGEDAPLVLFPTTVKFAVIAAVGTEGANYGVRTDHVIAWLKEMEDDNPFNLIVCNHESVGGAFLRPVSKPKELAAKLVEFCPSLVDDLESPDELAPLLKKQKSFLLRWD